MQKKTLLSLAMLLTVPIAAQVNHALPTFQALAVARMVAQDQRYDLHRSNLQFREILLPNGQEQDPKYMNIGLYRDGRLLREYAIRKDTGDVVDPINCKILRYPNLLKFKRTRMRKLGTHEASLNLIAAEVGCDTLHPVGGLDSALSRGRPTADLKRELAVQHFTGMLKGDVSFKLLGKFLCGSKLLDVIYYSWTETAPVRGAHAAYRILFMNGKKYLGSYSVEYPPEVHGNVEVVPVVRTVFVVS